MVKFPPQALLLPRTTARAPDQSAPKAVRHGGTGKEMPDEEFQNLNTLHIGRNYPMRGMNRKIILVSICTLVVTARGLAQASNQDATIGELQRQLDEMRSQMVKMQTQIAGLLAARGIPA